MCKGSIPERSDEDDESTKEMSAPNSVETTTCHSNGPVAQASTTNGGISSDEASQEQGSVLPAPTAPMTSELPHRSPELSWPIPTATSVGMLPGSGLMPPTHPHHLSSSPDVLGGIDPHGHLAGPAHLLAPQFPSCNFATTGIVNQHSMGAFNATAGIDKYPPDPLEMKQYYDQMAYYHNPYLQSQPHAYPY